jgi:hypothetical protein
VAVTERAFVAGPIASADNRVITAPFQFYVTGEDKLRIRSVCSIAAVTLQFRARFVDEKGKIQAESWTHQPNSNRTLATTVQSMGVGALLNLDVFASVGGILVGQCFVIVDVVRGDAGTGFPLGVMLQGYVTTTQSLAWPGSPIVTSTFGEPAIREISGTQPGAGGNISEVVPTGARWELICLYTRLTTSAAAGTRQPALRLSTPAGPLYMVSPLSAGIAASQVMDITWGQGMPAANIAAWHGQTAPLPNGQKLMAGDFITTSTLAIDAADQYDQVTYSVREWLEVN